MKYITHQAIIQCPHGGVVSLSHVTDCGIHIANGYPVLKQHIVSATITGCTFATGPCLTIATVPDIVYAPNQKFNNDQILTDLMDKITLTNNGSPLSLVYPGS